MWGSSQRLQPQPLSATIVAQANRSSDLIELANAAYSYSGNDLLRDLNLRLAPGIGHCEFQKDPAVRNDE